MVPTLSLLLVQVLLEPCQACPPRVDRRLVHELERRAVGQPQLGGHADVATGDRMQTTAGSLALEGTRATRDAHIVEQLRQAGALILAKTNLSEWGNIRSNRSTSGWSSRGGLTRNPYALDRNTKIGRAHV